MLFASKIVSSLIYPAGMVCLLILLCAIFYAAKKNRLAFVCGFFAAIILYACSSPYISHVVVRSLESKFDQPSDFPHVSAIVVLGGSTVPAVPPRKYVEISEAGDRILHGARLFKKGYAPYLICTGGKIPFLSDFQGSEANNMASLYKDLWSIDTPQVVIEDKSQTTHDHTSNVAKILDMKKLPHTIILVTSAAHMYRSVRLFTKAGYTVYPAPTDYLTEKNVKLSIFGFLPSAESLNSTTSALHEYYGIIAYKIKGWI